MTHTITTTASGFTYNGVSYANPAIAMSSDDNKVSVRINESVYQFRLTDTIVINGSAFSGTAAELATALNSAFAPTGGSADVSAASLLTAAQAMDGYDANTPKALVFEEGQAKLLPVQINVP